jgi:hypothetical protein
VVAGDHVLESPTCSPRVGITLVEWRQARLRRRLTKDRLVQLGVRKEPLQSSVLL